MRRTRWFAFLMFLLFAVATQLLEFGIGQLVVKLMHIRGPMGWRPSFFIGVETIGAVSVLIATAAIALIQRRRIAEYGFATRNFWRETIAGALWGLGTVVVLVAAIASLGGYNFGSLAMHGQQLVAYVTAWFAAFALVGLAEEMLFRGPSLILLGESIGFWPAAIALSLLFGGAHYFLKPGENLADGLSVTLIGLFCCYTVRVTGNIWFAVAFHALFDYAAIFLFGAPNSGNGGKPIDTKLLTGSYHGAPWLTGGPLGVEASWLVFPLIAVLFLGIRWTRYYLAVQNEGGTA